MVPPRIDLEDFRLQIQHRLLVSKQTHAQIAEWLEEEGIIQLLGSSSVAAKNGAIVGEE
jgi:hypothetical protein